VAQAGNELAAQQLLREAVKKAGRRVHERVSSP